MPKRKAILWRRLFRSCCNRFIFDVLSDDELLDQSRQTNQVNWYKPVNLVLICTSVLIPLLTIIKIWIDSKIKVSPFLPEFVVYFINNKEINISCFLLGALVPALLLRYIKKYTLSSICILLFFFAGFILRRKITLYEYILF